MVVGMFIVASTKDRLSRYFPFVTNANQTQSDAALQKAMNNKDEWLAFVQTCLHFSCVLPHSFLSYVFLLLVAALLQGHQIVCVCLYGLRNKWCTLAHAIIRNRFSIQCLFLFVLLAFLSLSRSQSRASGEKLMHAKWWCFLHVVRKYQHRTSTELWSLIKFYIPSQHWPGFYACSNNNSHNDVILNDEQQLSNTFQNTEIKSVATHFYSFLLSTQLNGNDCAVINFNLTKSSYFIRTKMGIWLDA